MATYSAIADVGKTLLELLQNQMSDTGPINKNEVGLVSPAELGQGDKVRLTLYLYHVSGNSHFKNDGKQTIDADTVKQSPLALDLYYLLTAHPSSGGGNDETRKTRDQHRVLGHAMQVLHDNAILSGSDLKGNLPTEEELHVSVNPQAMNEVTNIWNTFNEIPFRPSVSYLVSPVLIESTQEEEIQRVIEKEEQYRLY